MSVDQSHPVQRHISRRFLLRRGGDALECAQRSVEIPATQQLIAGC
jgi:hypothetical protein